MATGPEQEIKNDLVLSFLSVRRALGYLGFFLPISLVVVGVVSGDGIAPSISDFYFTSAGDILVGVLSAIGIFLWTYKGFDKRPGEWISDRLIARLAAIGAFGVAFIPTKGLLIDPAPMMHRLIGVDASRILHYASAALFFVCLAIFCLVLFRRHDTSKPMSRQKRARNKIYRICGIVIVAIIVLIVVFAWYYSRQSLLGRDQLDDYAILFYLETVGIFAFAVSWLTKGNSLKPLARALERPD